MFQHVSERIAAPAALAFAVRAALAYALLTAAALIGVERHDPCRTRCQRRPLDRRLPNSYAHKQLGA
jgi:hypothetical protein